MIEFWVGLRSHHPISLRTAGVVLQVADTAMGLTLETSWRAEAGAGTTPGCSLVPLALEQG